ncbi:MAG: hypothetical protein JNN01_18865 [Opitutaceae bacterium]|nr:hypothetical protein [Opitutaceae bacterium]
MNTVLRSLLISLALALGSTAQASRLPASDPTDHPARLLANHGIIPVASAGPYIERGSARILVTAKLGRPSERLQDGTWLYKGYRVTDSDAAGTLVIHFLDGRVTSLGLATPERAAALAAATRSLPTSLQVVSHERP